MDSRGLHVGVVASACTRKRSRKGSPEPVNKREKQVRNGRAAALVGQRRVVSRRDRNPALASWPVSRVLYGGACAPRGGHSSGTAVADRLLQPTRTSCLETGWAEARDVPIRFCSRWGFPCRNRCRPRGGLLPHPFTLAGRRERGPVVCFLRHFPWGRPRRALPGTVSPWSPDFPRRRPFGTCRRGRPANWRGDIGVRTTIRQTIRSRAARTASSTVAVSASTTPSTRAGRK